MTSKNLTTLRAGAPVTAAINDLVYAVRDGQRVALLADEIALLGEGGTRLYTKQVNFDANDSVSLGTLGADIITNGDFATDSDWTKGTGWTISASAAHCDGTQVTSSYLTQTLAGEHDDWSHHTVKYTLSNVTAGYVRPYFNNGPGDIESTNGTHYAEVTATVGSDTFRIQASSTFVGSITDIIVQKSHINEWDLDTDETATIIWDAHYLLPNPINMVDGNIYTLKIVQTTPFWPGQITIDWTNDYIWPYDSGRGYYPADLTFADGAVDIFTFYSDGTDMHGIHRQSFL